MMEVEEIQPEDAAEPTSWLGRLNDRLERIKPGVLWGAAGLFWVGLSIAASGPEWWMLVVAIWAAPKLWIELSGSGPLFEPEDLEGGANLPPRVRVTAGILALPFLLMTIASTVSWEFRGFSLLSFLGIALMVIAATGGGYIWAFSERPGGGVDSDPSELDDDARAVLRVWEFVRATVYLLIGLAMLLSSLYEIVKIFLEPEIDFAGLLVYLTLACAGGFLVRFCVAWWKTLVPAPPPAQLPGGGPELGPAALTSGDPPFRDIPIASPAEPDLAPVPRD